MSYGSSVKILWQFQLTCLTYKALNTSKPTYLYTLLTPYTPPLCLRSSGTRLLAEPRYRTVMGSRAFHFSAPKEWNRLQLSLDSSNSLPFFKSSSKLTISSWLSRNWKINWIFTWWLTICVSDSHFGVTLSVLQISFVFVRHRRQPRKLFLKQLSSKATTKSMWTFY